MDVHPLKGARSIVSFVDQTKQFPFRALPRLINVGFLALGVLAMAVSPSIADDYSWSGSGFGSWDTTGNWTPKGIPGIGNTKTDRATISNAAVNKASGSINLISLALNGGCQLQISGNSSLSANTVTFASGSVISMDGNINSTLTIDSVSALSGSIAKIGSAYRGDLSKVKVINNGSVTRNTAGTSEFYNFNNNGSVNATAGNLNFVSGAVNGSGGVISINSGGDLTYVGTNNGVINVSKSRLTPGAQTGSGVFNLTNATLQTNGVYTFGGTSTLNVAGGLSLSGATLLVSDSAKIVADSLSVSGSQLRFSGAKTFDNSVAFTNSSGISLDGNVTSSLTIGSGKTLNGSLSQIGAVYQGNSNNVNVVNNGSVVRDVSGVTTLSNFTNNGVVKATKGGSLTFSSGINYGTLNADTGSVLSVSSGVKQSGGQIVVDGTMQVTGGTLSLLGGVVSGVGTINGSISNGSATVSPGNSPGKLTINGNYSQGANGKLHIELGSSASDQLVVTGTTSLGGTLEVALFASYFPEVGKTFTILSSGGAISGFFDRVIGLDAGWNYRYDTFGGTGRLTVLPQISVNAPEPGSLGLAFFGLATMIGLIRLRHKSL